MPTKTETLAVQLREAAPKEEQGKLTFEAWLAVARVVELNLENAALEAARKQKDKSVQRVLDIPLGELDAPSVVKAIMGGRRRK